jgi:His-Xaa-Ser system protein HxsD
VELQSAANPAVTHDLRFSLSAHSLESIKKAAYRFTHVCAFEFAIDGSEIVCRMHFDAVQTPERLRSIEMDVRNEVLDQELRATIGEETAAIRNAILAYAFSRTGLQSADEV